jgi:hypothetical protein
MKLKKLPKGGELTEIEIEEVSIVDAPANQRPFLLKKREGIRKAEVEIVITSDKTLDGTTITVNGKTLEDLKSFYFNLFRPDEDEEEYYIDPVSCVFTMDGGKVDGFESSESFELLGTGE